jgi:hypothetical protein
MLGGLCVGKVGVQVACVFLQTTALMIQKAPCKYSSTNQQQKLWPLASNVLMVWCRAGLRGDFLSVYTDFFYEQRTLANL